MLHRLEYIYQDQTKDRVDYEDFTMVVLEAGVIDNQNHADGLQHIVIEPLPGLTKADLAQLETELAQCALTAGQLLHAWLDEA